MGTELCHLRTRHLVHVPCRLVYVMVYLYVTCTCAVRGTIMLAYPCEQLGVTV